MVAFSEAQLETWYAEAFHAISEWEDSLDSLEDILLSGQWEKLVHFPMLAEEPIQLLAKIQNLRDQLLAEASSQGLPASSLTRLIDFLGLPGGTRKIRALQNRFQRSYARMLAAWTQLRLCDETVQGMLHLIATGSAAEATYGSNERRHLEGGILMDESA